MNSFDSLVNKNLGWVHENKYVFHVLSLFLGMYAALARPKLPRFVEKLFENPVFRLVMISYIIYRGNQDPQLAVMIAAAFLITIHMINKRKVEKMTNGATPGGTAAPGGGGATLNTGGQSTCNPPCLRNIERMTVPGSPGGSAVPAGGASGGSLNTAGQSTCPPSCR